MVDRELLERAAKAAGHEFKFGEDCIAMYKDLNGLYYPSQWNPLTDDGDALRLAVKLNITDLCLVVGQLVLAEGFQQDKYAATRRAIVRAAAALADAGGRDADD
ncbi:hypothetical protein [Ralstonia sp. Ralssp135]|uniref:hypothetical protein n=1 Tax=Ralstonia sp. Ralssp135 TaxID=3243016 RepID=UPI0039AEB2B9